MSLATEEAGRDFLTFPLSIQPGGKHWGLTHAEDHTRLSAGRLRLCDNQPGWLYACSSLLNQLPTSFSTCNPKAHTSLSDFLILPFSSSSHVPTQDKIHMLLPLCVSISLSDRLPLLSLGGKSRRQLHIHGAGSGKNYREHKIESLYTPLLGNHFQCSESCLIIYPLLPLYHPFSILRLPVSKDYHLSRHLERFAF